MRKYIVFFVAALVCMTVTVICFRILPGEKIDVLIMIALISTFFAGSFLAISLILCKLFCSWEEIGNGVFTLVGIVENKYVFIDEFGNPFSCLVEDAKQIPEGLIAGKSFRKTGKEVIIL